MVEVVGADHLLRSACRLRPAAPRSVALDRGLFEGSPDLLTDGHALLGSPPTTSTIEKGGLDGRLTGGGSGGSRTHVRKHFRRNFSERS